MENHIYKHHFRHGHHHHKHNIFYGLLAMSFFALVALFVVASIYYTIIPRESATTQNAAGGTCLVGTVDCNDTPNW